jgi:hypothetical protein
LKSHRATLLETLSADEVVSRAKRRMKRSPL